MRDGGRAESIGVTGEHRLQRRRPIPGIVTVDQCTGHAVAHRHRQTADGSGHHRGTAGLRLDGDQSEGFVVARHRDHVGSAVDTDQFVA